MGTAVEFHMYLFIFKPFQSPQGSSSSSSLSEADAEEADVENGSELPRTQNDLVLERKDEAKSSLPSYPTQQVQLTLGLLQWFLSLPG